MPAFDKPLASAIAHFFSSECASVLDIGCGPGLYLEFMVGRMKGPLVGLEPLISVEGEGWRIIPIDVTSGNPDNLGPFDLVLCLEVAEHIARDKHAALFDAIARKAPRWVVFSGAVPGQTGWGHVSCRPETEWMSEFEARGYRPVPSLSIWLRSMAYQSWFQQNLLVFLRKGNLCS